MAKATQFTLPINFTIQNTEADIRRGISSAVVELLNTRWSSNAVLHAAIKRDISSYMIAVLKTTDTYRELVRSKGTLRTEFGLQYKEAQVDPIIEKVAESVVVHFPQFKAMPGGAISGTIIVSALEANFEHELVNEPTASFISEKSQTVIPWLQWLLTQGDRIVVAGYTTKVFPTHSRTRSLIMVEAKPAAAGPKNYRVPTDHSGTLGDNFITKAFGTTEVQIVGDLLKRRLQGAL